MAKRSLPKGMGQMGGGNMQQLMMKAQKMQQDMARIQEEMENKELSVSAGGGAITVVITGKKEIKSVVISPEAVDPEDVEMLQDLVVTAVNQAIHQAEEMMESEMSKVTGATGMPGLF